MALVLNHYVMILNVLNVKQNKMSDQRRGPDSLELSAIIITIVFIILKLTHVINWSWWYVWAPIWSIILIGIYVVALKLAPLPIRFIGICAGVIFLLIQLSKVL